MKSYKEIIIITGGLGHIGSSLFKSLESPDKFIIVNDNLMAERYCSTFKYHMKDNLEFVFGDIRDKKCIDLILEKSNSIDYLNASIIHLAAITDAASSFEKSDSVKDNNFNGTKAIIELANLLDANLYFPSSTSVYGDNSNLVTETSILHPQSPYAETKIIEEELVSKYSKNLILRLGTIVGPSGGMRFHTAVNSFIWKALTKKPIQIWKTAYEQMRPYLCLKDLVSLFKFALENTSLNHNIYNILTTNSTPREITDIIKEYIDNISIEFVDSKIMNQLSYEVSKELIEKEGFKFKSNIHEGIKDTIEFLVDEKYFK
tara:strand:+ start:5708 stop:6658 length:951 start_codon:yes stop_codon:yes gene_type:complete